MARDLGIVLIPDSFFRQERIDELLRERPVSVPLLQKALRDHTNHPDGICAHEHEDEQEFLRSATIASLIMDLSAAKLWVSDGNPCQRSYCELDFSARFRRGSEPRPFANRVHEIRDGWGADSAERNLRSETARTYRPYVTRGFWRFTDLKH